MIDTCSSFFQLYAPPRKREVVKGLGGRNNFGEEPLSKITPTKPVALGFDASIRGQCFEKGAPLIACLL